MSSVDEQLNQFRFILLNNLTDFCNETIDIEAWEFTETHTQEIMFTLRSTIDDAYEDIMDEYRNSTRTWMRLDEHRRMIQAVAWATLNVPYPVDPIMYLERFCVNNIILCRDMDDVRSAMISANHHCELIQRSWRKCISDPNYVVCKNRLKREYSEFSKEIEEFQSQINLK